MCTAICPIVSLFALGIILAGAPAVAEAAQGQPTVAKTGWVDNPKLRDAAPPAKVIVSQKRLAALYRAWKLGDDVPKVDFKKELVVVATDKSQGNLLAVVDKGDLKIEFAGPPSDKEGFGYVIQTVSREGVKTVHGKPLPKE